MTRREYAQERVTHYWNLYIYAPRYICAWVSYRRLMREWNQYIDFHDYMKYHMQKDAT